MDQLEIETLLQGLSVEERIHVLRILRDRFKLAIHPLEQKWNTAAELILEAIDMAGDLTQRGIRGVLAEATFRTVVVPQSLSRWKEQPFPGNESFDVMLLDAEGPMRVQVKLQRKEKGVPKIYRGSADHFVVETQRTRGGKRRNDELSRPYRVDEFDVLAVCLHPSSNDWESFTYCAVNDLLTRPQAPKLLAVMQPVPMGKSSTWTRDFDLAAMRYRASRS